MATDIHPEVSPKNKYYISKELYYELKHFCRQYPEWQKAYSTFAPNTTAHYGETVKDSELQRPAENMTVFLDHFKSKMDLVDNTLREADPDISKYLNSCI